jgi:predicted outer membrane repeat protein
MYSENLTSESTLTDVTFSGNSARLWGGGIYNDSSNATLTDVEFNGNSASTDGGGMYNDSSSPTLTDVEFNGNSASTDGGGMCNYFASSPTLTNVTFSGEPDRRHFQWQLRRVRRRDVQRSEQSGVGAEHLYQQQRHLWRRRDV